MTKTCGKISVWLHGGTRQRKLKVHSTRLSCLIYWPILYHHSSSFTMIYRHSTVIVLNLWHSNVKQSKTNYYLKLSIYIFTMYISGQGLPGCFSYVSTFSTRLVGPVPRILILKQRDACYWACKRLYMWQDRNIAISQPVSHAFLRCIHVQELRQCTCNTIDNSWIIQLKFFW